MGKGDVGTEEGSGVVVELCSDKGFLILSFSILEMPLDLRLRGSNNLFLIALVFGIDLLLLLTPLVLLLMSFLPPTFSRFVGNTKNFFGPCSSSFDPGPFMMVMSLLLDDVGSLLSFSSSSWDKVARANSAKEPPL